MFYRILFYDALQDLSTFRKHFSVAFFRCGSTNKTVILPYCSQIHSLCEFLSLQNGSFNCNRLLAF